MLQTTSQCAIFVDQSGSPSPASLVGYPGKGVSHPNKYLASTGLSSTASSHHPLQNASLADTQKTNMTGWNNNHLKMYLPLRNWDFPLSFSFFCGCDFPQFKLEHSQVMILSSKKLYTLHIRRFRRGLLSFHYCPWIFDLYHQTARPQRNAVSPRSHGWLKSIELAASNFILPHPAWNLDGCQPKKGLFLSILGLMV